MTDHYRPPESPLVDPVDLAAIEGSIERALAGDFEFDPVQAIGDGWQLTSGVKGAVFVGGFCMIVLSIAVQIVGNILMPAPPDAGSVAGFLWGIPVGLIQSIAVAPILGGMWWVAMRQSAGYAVSVGDVFSQFSKVGPIVGVTLLSTFLIYLGFLLLVIPGIYLSIAYFMALPLVIDKGLSPWQALETSRKAVTHCWWRMLVMLLLAGMIVGFSALFLLIPLIWTFPLMLLTFAVSYRSIFGISSPEDA